LYWFVAERRRTLRGRSPLQDETPDEDDYMDEAMKHTDKVAMERIVATMEDYESDMNNYSGPLGKGDRSRSGRVLHHCIFGLSLLCHKMSYSTLIDVLQCNVHFVQKILVHCYVSVLHLTFLTFCFTLLFRFVALHRNLNPFTADCFCTMHYLYMSRVLLS
jgi:hypothetical protein